MDEEKRNALISRIEKLNKEVAEIKKEVCEMTGDHLIDICNCEGIVFLTEPAFKALFPEVAMSGIEVNGHINTIFGKYEQNGTAYEFKVRSLVWTA